MASLDFDEVSDCTGLPFPELSDLCHLATAQGMATGRPTAESSQRACEAIGDERWRGDCYFTVAMRLVSADDIGRSLGMCLKSVRFQSICITHLAYNRLRLPGGLGDVAGPGAQAEAFRRQQAQVETVRSGTLGVGKVGVTPAIASELATGFLTIAYHGSGRADPALVASVDRPHQAMARSAFFDEAVRLAVASPRIDDGAVISRVLASWHQESPPLSGKPLLGQEAKRARHERKKSGTDRHLESIRSCLEDPEPEVPLLCEALRSAAGDLHTPAGVFVPYLADPEPCARAWGLYGSVKRAASREAAAGTCSSFAESTVVFDRCVQAKSCLKQAQSATPK